MIENATGIMCSMGRALPKSTSIENVPSANFGYKCVRVSCVSGAAQHITIIGNISRSKMRRMMLGAVGRND